MARRAGAADLRRGRAAGRRGRARPARGALPGAAQRVGRPRRHVAAARRPGRYAARCWCWTTASTSSRPRATLADQLLADNARAAHPGHQPRAARHHRRGLAGRADARSAGTATPRAAEALEFPAVRLFADRAAAVRPDFAVDDATVGRRHRDRAPPGRPAAGHRAGCGAVAHAAAARDRGSAVRPVPAADRRQPHGAAAPPHPARRGRVELGAAHARRAAPRRAAVGVPVRHHRGVGHGDQPTRPTTCRSCWRR